MIQQETRLKAVGNSGAKELLCIRVLGGTRRRYASLGDVIVVTVKSANPKGKIKKGEVSHAVVVRTRKEYRRQDGTYVRFEENAAVLVNEFDKKTNTYKPKATRVFGPVPRELRTQFPEVVSMAPETV